MTATPTPFTQLPHKLLVIPGPIEIADDVLFANAHPSMSHVGPEFILVFGDCIRMIRDLLRAPSAQPFLISGSGTLGWDQVAANLIEPGDDVLVLTTGYFGDSFADCLRVYGAKPEQLIAPVGAAISQDQLVSALKAKKYKAVTFTHVDTSTAVLNDARMIASTVKQHSPETLVVADCVCSVASEELDQEDWGIDVVLTASQKGIGAPPGLSIISASPAAMKVFESRVSPVTSYYASWHKWLPIMKAYEAGSPAYFATPPVNLIYALNTTLTTITQGKLALSERLAHHREASKRVKSVCKELGLNLVTTDARYEANGMTAVYAPDGVSPADIIGPMGKKGVVVAGGLHKDIKAKYFRIGHMGVSVADSKRDDIDRLVDALTEVVKSVRKN